jgi:hypothetical protein
MWDGHWPQNGLTYHIAGHINAATIDENNHSRHQKGKEGEKGEEAGI